jgi:Zn-finger nucleic acid-binding protein
MWFEPGDLERVKDDVMPDLAWLDLDIWKEKAEFKARRSPIFCPACRDVALTRIRDTQSPTEMDMCNSCRGAWLGTGQFLNLVNALLDEASRMSAPDYIKLSLQQAGEILSNPGAIISEWQDLKKLLQLLRHRLFVENPKLESVLFGLQKSLPL